MEKGVSCHTVHFSVAFEFNAFILSLPFFLPFFLYLLFLSRRGKCFMSEYSGEKGKEKRKRMKRKTCLNRHHINYHRLAAGNSFDLVFHGFLH
jgi:hypothetical protein